MANPSFVEVAFPIPLNRTFHYQSNGDVRGPAPVVGRRVLAPFGKKGSLVGYVVGQTNEKPSFATKAIQAFLDSEPFIDSTLLDLARWLADRYLCSLGEALACIVPPHLAAPKRPRAKEDVIPAVVSRPSTLLGGPPALSCGGRNPGTLTPLDPGFRRGDGNSPSLKLSAEQKRVLERIMEAVGARRFEPFLLRGITDSGKTELYLRAVDRALAEGRQSLFLLPEIALTPPFITKLKTRYSSDRVGLWHSGISGGERYQTWTGVKSGQIQVLLGARSAVFAPFPQLGLIVMDEEHEPSYKQEDRPRYHTREVALKRAEQTHSVLIMGSATPSLESYWKAKQGMYTLLELTSRVEQKSLPPVTLIDRRPPRISSPLVGEEGGGGLQSLGDTPHPAPLPTACRGWPGAIGESVPGRPSPTRGEGNARRRNAFSFAVFSEPLKLAIEQRLARREQLMLFVNRRGFTPFLRCQTCGWVARCPRCSTTLAMHLKDALSLALPREGGGDSGKYPLPSRERVAGGRERGPAPADGFLQCHACLYKERVPIQCPSCKGMRLHQYGIGTQRVEQEMRRLFPFVKLARLDHDLASSRRVYEKIYNDFEKGELDALVGTQMIAKGFDFPKVTLVGVVDADVTLHLPDFRSAERTFDLIAQVAGRTGRGESRGQVLVQTHHPDHYALQAAQTHDYLRFYNEEIGYRQTLSYPPFCSLIHILIRGMKETVVQSSAEQFADKLAVLGNDVTVLGPAPAPYSRLRKQYRYQIVLKGTEAALAPFRNFLHHYRLPKAFMSVDVDPMDLL